MADRSAGCSKKREQRRGTWTYDEDIRLISYITFNGEGRWEFLAKESGLKRSGRSCRLRWVNYLSPDLNHTNITPGEERLIVDLHARWGNRWSRIAQSLPGRTDNGIKNYWKTHLKKRNKVHDNGESKLHSDSLTHFSSCPISFEAPLGLQRGTSNSFLRKTTENTIEHIAISSLQTNPIPYKNKDFESESLNAAAAKKSTEFEAPNGVEFRAVLEQEEYSRDLTCNFSVETFSPELCRSSEVGYSLHNSHSPEAFSNGKFYSDELWQMDE